MSASHDISLRSVALRLRRPLPPEVRAEVEAALGALRPAPGFRLNGRLLQIDYAFPDLNVAQIWDVLQATSASAAITSGSRCRCLFAALLEENERDRLLPGGGWHRYVAEIYAHYFDLRRRRSDPRRQQWKKYHNEIKGTE